LTTGLYGLARPKHQAGARLGLLSCIAQAGFMQQTMDGTSPMTLGPMVVVVGDPAKRACWRQPDPTPAGAARRVRSFTT
jgi:hypothetical protein